LHPQEPVLAALPSAAVPPPQSAQPGAPAAPVESAAAEPPIADASPSSAAPSEPAAVLPRGLRISVPGASAAEGGLKHPRVAELLLAGGHDIRGGCVGGAALGAQRGSMLGLSVDSPRSAAAASPVATPSAERGPGLKELVSATDKHGETILHLAAAAGSKDVLELFLTLRPKLVHAKCGPHNNTLAHFAALGPAHVAEYFKTVRAHVLHNPDLLAHSASEAAEIAWRSLAFCPSTDFTISYARSSGSDLWPMAACIRRALRKWSSNRVTIFTSA
jgi:hypothetical protein